MPPTLAPTIRPTTTRTPMLTSTPPADPTAAPEISVAWTRHDGTAADEGASAIAVDDGGISVVGTTSGTCETPLPGGSDGFIQRYDVAGEVLWTRQFGTPGQDWAKDVAADASGLTLLWVSDGSFESRDNAWDLFLRRYDPDGNVLWTRQWGQEGGDQVLSIAVDETGITAVGQTTNSPYEEDLLPTQATSAATTWRARSSGRRSSAARTKRLQGVTADAAGLNVTGHTYGSLDGPNEGTFDVFVRRYDRAGKVVWATQFGTSAEDMGMDVAADAAGFTIVGHTNGSLGGPGKGDLDLLVRRYTR